MTLKDLTPPGNDEIEDVDGTRCKPDFVLANYLGVVTAENTTLVKSFGGGWQVIAK